MSIQGTIGYSSRRLGKPLGTRTQVSLCALVDLRLRPACHSRDASAAFDYVEHSSSARRALQRLATPALDSAAKTCVELLAVRRRQQRRAAREPSSATEHHAATDGMGRSVKGWAGAFANDVPGHDASGRAGRGGLLGAGASVSLRWGRAVYDRGCAVLQEWHTALAEANEGSFMRGTAAALLREAD